MCNIIDNYEDHSKLLQQQVIERPLFPVIFYIIYRISFSCMLYVAVTSRSTVHVVKGALYVGWNGDRQT